MSRLGSKMKQSRSAARRHDDRGAILVMFALLLVVLITFAGLCVDGGRAYGLNRQMQNAADASAMAGGRALDKYQSAVYDGGSPNSSEVYTAAVEQAEADGANVDAGNFGCRLLDFNRNDLGACPVGAGANIPSNAAGVKVTTTQTESTLLAQVAGISTYTANSDAT